MGLAISREVLRRDGFDLKLIKSGIDVNPVFSISTIGNMEVQEEQQ
jgi:hypothetical protein